jgi:lipopolysaccharide transport system permease protein
MLGALWALLNPLSLLVVFSFVFGLVLKARWGNGGHSVSLILFSGLVLFIFFSDCVNRSPLLVIQNSNYVKKVVFPLELLPAVSVGGALVNLGISMAVLFIGQLWIEGGVRWTWLLMPVVVAPLVLAAAGVSYLFASLGVFIRDLAQITGTLTMILMYMSPILYPLDLVPIAFRPWLNLNPLTIPVTQFRQLILDGTLPDWSLLGGYILVAYVFLVFSFWWFWRTRNGFSDVL